METALAALEWTGAVGILQDDDLLHAARLTSETAAAVIERKAQDGRRYVYLGPRLDAPPMDVFEGAILFDEPGVKAVEFTQRAHAPGPLPPSHRRRRRAAGAAGAPRTRDSAPAPLARAHHPGARHSPSLVAGWFAARLGRMSLLTLEGEPTYRYIEVGMES